MEYTTSTIFALSSAPGKAGVAVFRISGPNSVRALGKLIKKSTSEILEQFEERKLYNRKIYEYSNGDLIDHAMVIYFKAPASFTGEDVVEIHTHGSIAIINLLSASLLSMKDIVMAERGEFAKRAFLNNKFDLTAAEGLADLIEAETKYQHKQALAQSSGGLADIYNNWRSQLLKIISLLEAYIDFPDEDIPDTITLEIKTNVKKLFHEIEHYLNDNRRGERLRNGITLSIIGSPNVGKSTLLNFLLQREMAIVSPIAGTTRDIIEGHLDIGGYPIILQDTAGIRADFVNSIEGEGIKRSIAAAANADLKIIMFENPLTSSNNDLLSLIDENTIAVLNKIDIIDNEHSFKLPIDTLNISLKNKIGLDKLLYEIEDKAKNLVKIDQQPAVTRIRHRKFLELTAESLDRFDLDNDLILSAEDIRMAIRYLGNITGIITVEEILGEIFANFCIGK